MVLHVFYIVLGAVPVYAAAAAGCVVVTFVITILVVLYLRYFPFSLFQSLTYRKSNIIVNCRNSLSMYNFITN